MGDAVVCRVWVKDRFGLSSVGIRGHVCSCAGQAKFSENNFVAVSIGDVRTAFSFLAAGLVTKVVVNKPFDVLGNIRTNADVGCDNDTIALDDNLTVDTNCEFRMCFSAFSPFDIRLPMLILEQSWSSQYFHRVDFVNTATADALGHTSADDVYVKTCGALRTNHKRLTGAHG